MELRFYETKVERRRYDKQREVMELRNDKIEYGEMGKLQIPFLVHTTGVPTTSAAVPWTALDATPLPRGLEVPKLLFSQSLLAPHISWH